MKNSTAKNPALYVAIFVIFVIFYSNLFNIDKGFIQLINTKRRERANRMSQLFLDFSCSNSFALLVRPFID